MVSMKQILNVTESTGNSLEQVAQQHGYEYQSSNVFDVLTKHYTTKQGKQGKATVYVRGRYDLASIEISPPFEDTGGAYIPDYGGGDPRASNFRVERELPDFTDYTYTAGGLSPDEFVEGNHIAKMDAFIEYAASKS